MPALRNISVRTIQGLCLRKLNWPYRKMAVKPLLTQAMKDKRLAFCERYRNWTVKDWNNVMFSDKSPFELTFGNKSSRCRRPTGFDRLELRFTKKSVKQLPKLTFSRMGTLPEVKDCLLLVQ